MDKADNKRLSKCLWDSFDNCNTIKLASLLLRIGFKHTLEKIFQFKGKQTYSHQKVPEHPLQRNGRKSRNQWIQKDFKTVNSHVGQDVKDVNSHSVLFTRDKAKESLAREQLHNTGAHLKVYIFNGSFGSAVDERTRNNLWCIRS